MFKFSSKSKDKLLLIHPDLKRMVEHALEISKIDFTVIEGIRTIDKQKEYYDNGKSWTLNSRHLTGHAVDLVPYVNGSLSWNSTRNYNLIAKAMFRASQDCGFHIEWGGFWLHVDMPHWQLPWNEYSIRED